MKKIIGIGMAALIALAGLALAGQVYNQTSTTLSATGALTWTNLLDYSAVKIVGVTVEHRNAFGANTVTVKRVAASGVFTNTLGTISVASNVGTLGSGLTNTAYLARGDTLVFSSVVPTSAVVLIEYEVQQH